MKIGFKIVACKAIKISAWSVIGLLAVSLGAGGDAWAQKITPSQVYQVVENVEAELALLLDANFSDTKIPAEQVIPGMRPRHVLREARHVMRQIALLKQINALPVKAIEPIPVREITPGDVKSSVDRVLTEVRALRKPFGITAKAKPAVLRQGKKPADVLARLKVVAELVQRLDIPAIVPNDVYRIALAIKADALQIHAALQTPAPQAIPEGIRGKKPPHVYARGYDLLAKLKALTGGNKRLAVPGGVITPPQKTANLKPADVLGILNNVLAELSSIKVVTGATETSPTVPAQAGKTPNDVYIVVEETIALIAAVARAS